MVNFLVNDMDGIIERLAEHGVTAEPIDGEPYGRSSWATDLEGNRFELWEPTSR